MIRKWRVICDRCGFKLWNYDLRKEWTGLRVCTRCFEARHPQDRIRVTPDRQSPPWVRPEPTDEFTLDFLEDDALNPIVDENGQVITAPGHRQITLGAADFLEWEGDGRQDKANPDENLNPIEDDTGVPIGAP